MIIQLLQVSIKKNPLSRILHSQAGILLLIRGLGLCFLFIAQIALARVLGDIGFGIYSAAISLATLLVVFTKLGTDISIIRLANRYYIKQRWALFKGCWNFSRLLVLSVSVLIPLASGLLLLVFADTSHGNQAATLVALAIIPPLALLSLQRNFLVALGHPIKGVIVDQLFLPLLLILAAAAIWFFPDFATAPTAVGFYCLAVSIIAVLGWWWSRQHTPAVARAATPKYQPKTWLLLALPMILTIEGNVLIIQADILMVNAMIGATAAGYIAVAAKLAVLANIGMTTLNNIAASAISSAYERQAQDELQNIIFKYTRISFAIACLIALFMSLFSELALKLFGDGFVAAQSAFFILLAAQVMMTAFGPGALLLAMTGNQKQAAIITALSVLLNLAGNLVLIPYWGINGATIATFIALTFQFSAMAYVAHKALAVRSFLY